MTQPDPAQRLHAAIAALCDPTVVRVDRLAITDTDRNLVRATNAEAAQNHRDQIAHYRRQLAAYEARHDDAGVRRVQALIDGREERHKAAIERRRVAQAVVPSLLDRLLDAVHGSGGSNGASGAGAHRSPIGLAAAELLAEIYRTVDWQREAKLVDVVRTWGAARAGDAFAAELVAAWVTTGLAIIEPPRMSEARAACPACNNRWAWVWEDGERVRKGAISINLSAGHAVCLHPSCGTRWDRDHFPLLAAALLQDVEERRPRRDRAVT